MRAEVRTALAVLCCFLCGTVRAVLFQNKPKAAAALPPQKLIQLAKQYLAQPTAEMLADDFVFRGPVIGPLVKKDFAATLKGVSSNIRDAFPDFQANAFGFSCDDPVEPMRVWYFVRPRGSFTGDFKDPFGRVVKATGKKLIGPPEARSMVFDEQGKIKHITVGYVTDRFTGDTTKGKGAVFGLYEVMGIGVPGDVGSAFLRVTQSLSGIFKLPISYSADKDLPAWWTDKRRGADP